MAVKAWHLPLRLVSGVYILNSGLTKRDMDPEAAEQLHGFASSGHPELKGMDPKMFVDWLSWSEIALGSALLLPIVPKALAGAGLTVFGLGMNRLYWNAPGLRRENDVRPTQDGISIAKDVWLTGIGAALLLDSLADRRERRRRLKEKRRAKSKGK